MHGRTSVAPSKRRWSGLMPQRGEIQGSTDRLQQNLPGGWLGMMPSVTLVVTEGLAYLEAEKEAF